MRILTAALITLLVLVATAIGCGDGDDGKIPVCDSEPEIVTTPNGVQFVRTPDSCFQNLPDFHYEAKYVLEGRAIHRAVWARISQSGR